jgi:hypothetical protein
MMTTMTMTMTPTTPATGKRVNLISQTDILSLFFSLSLRLQVFSFQYLFSHTMLSYP